MSEFDASAAVRAVRDDVDVTAIDRLIASHVDSASLTALVVALIRDGRHDDAYDGAIINAFKTALTTTNSQTAFIDAINVVYATDDDRERIGRIISGAVSAGVVSVSTLRASATDELLDGTGLWDVGTAHQRMLRIKTETFYTQRKYNLLREESEGFAKAVTEMNSFFSADGGAHVHMILRRLNALIGFFDLDPNRLSELIIQVYANCWRTRRGRGRRESSAAFVRVISEFHPNAVTALIGRLLANEADSNGHVFDVAAILIASRRSRLADVCAYLSPDDDALIAERTQTRQATRNSASRITMQTLTQTVPTPSSSSSAPSAATASAAVNKAVVDAGSDKRMIDAPIIKDTDIAPVQLAAVLSSPPTVLPAASELNPKYRLIIALVDANAFDFASELMIHLHAAEPVANHDVARALCQYVRRLIAPSYAVVAQSNGYQTLQKAHNGDDRGDGVGEAFTTAESFMAACRAPLTCLGVHLSHDPALVTLLCRLIASFPNLDDDENIRRLLADVLLPAYTVLPSNASLSSSMWSVLCRLKYEHRYALYGEWHYRLTCQSDPPTHLDIPELTVAYYQTVARTKYFRKRIAAARVKECARLLVKFALSAPTLVFELILAQVRQFDNMILPVIETIKYMAPFQLDVLSFTLLTQCASTQLGAKLKDDGLNEANWFQALCNFASHLYRRYCDVIDMTPLIQYVINSLKAESTLELLLLKSVILGVSGVEMYEETSETALDGRAGGRTLQSETTTVRFVPGATTGTNGAVSAAAPVKNRKRATAILLETLTRRRLLMPLVSLLSTAKAHIVYRTDYDHIKLIGELIDKTNETFAQIVELINANLIDDEEYAATLPSLYELVHDYHIAPHDAFHMVRRVLHMSKMTTINDTSVTAAAAAIKATPPKNSSLLPLINVCRRILPAAVVDAMSLELYATFWKLDLADIYIPKSAYAAAQKRVKQQIDSVDRDTVDTTDTAKKKRERERERLQRVAAKLKDELQQQQQRHNAAVQHIRREKDVYFAAPSLSAVLNFLRHCILPRAHQSPQDALYAARFISTLVRLGAPGFPIIMVVDQIVASMSALISSATAVESSRFGRFFAECLRDLHRIAYDQRVYNAEAATLPAFAVKLVEPAGTKLVFHQLQQLVHRIHDRLLQIFTSRLDQTANDNKTDVGNALLVLVRIGAEWPKSAAHVAVLERLLSAITNADENKSTAIKLLSSRAHALLMAQQRQQTLTQTIPPPMPPQIQAVTAAQPTLPRTQPPAPQPRPLQSAPPAQPNRTSAAPADSRPIANGAAVNGSQQRDDRRRAQPQTQSANDEDAAAARNKRKRDDHSTANTNAPPPPPPSQISDTDARKRQKSEPPPPPPPPQQQTPIPTQQAITTQTAHTQVPMRPANKQVQRPPQQQAAPQQYPQQQRQQQQPQPHSFTPPTQMQRTQQQSAPPTYSQQQQQPPQQQPPPPLPPQHYRQRR